MKLRPQFRSFAAMDASSSGLETPVSRRISGPVSDGDFHGTRLPSDNGATASFRCFITSQVLAAQNIPWLLASAAEPENRSESETYSRNRAANSVANSKD